LNDPQAPWPEAMGKKAGFQMHGYRLDQKQRPAFLYSLGDIQVEDYPVAAAGEIDHTITRTLTLRGGKEMDNLWFRAAVGSKIEAKANGKYWVDDKVALKFGLAAAAKPVIRQSGGQAELLVPVVFQNREARIVQEIVW